jgi:hypothetical protein
MPRRNAVAAGLVRNGLALRDVIVHRRDIRTLADVRRVKRAARAYADAMRRANAADLHEAYRLRRARRRRVLELDAVLSNAH